MAEPQPRREDSPSTAPDLRDAARNTQTGEPLKTAVEVVTSRLAETAEEGRAPAQGVGGDVPVRGGEQITAAVAGMIRRYPAASLLIGLGVGVGMGLLVSRRRRQDTTAAGA
jgi:ElaB/YqjD/DUF883 family membrane-anchored ribosome-binding protein